MNKCYKLALLSGPVFSNNMGCNALTYGSLEVLSEVAKKLNVEFEYYLLGNPVTGVVPPELASYKITFIEQIPDFSVKGLLRCAYRRNCRELICQADILKKADIYFDNNWGDSFSDIYGRERFNDIFHTLSYAINSGKPLILLPQTIGPFQSDDVKKRARKILQSAIAVYARDPLSVACAKEILPGVDVFGTIDVAFYMQYKKRDTQKKTGITVGINPSGLLWRGGYTGNNQFGLKDDYQTVIRSIVKYLLSLDGVSVELIGHDIKGPNAGNTADDYYVCKLLQNEFPQCKVGPFFYTPVEAKSYISGLDLLIGSRMHCCIAAYSSGVPVFPLTYSRKFKGLFAEKLGYPYLSELTEDNCEKVLSGMKNIIDQLEHIKMSMPERLHVIERHKEGLIEHLSVKLGQLL
jgi:polysaccharide pyruvyl transferase WcaK-like protein